MVSYASAAQSMHFCVVSYGLAAESMHFCVVSCGLAVLLAAPVAPPSGSWLLLAGAGAPKPGNPWFEQFYTEKLTDFRQGAMNLCTLRGEFEADIHSDRIFARKSAHGRRARDPDASVAPLIQNRKNPTGSSCFRSPVWGNQTLTSDGV